ncbi:ATP-dependent helicase [Bulleidia extructa]|uniref:ATP-dependent helicase n=1 Tax=Bulleidia extructa TaxID=118748 RepID=UPI002354949C|nr:UvrD-helicase domain-containing protein [Bulleidia extructa]
MLDIQSLNPQQKEAVLDEHQYLRIIAGAGSGKTRVLTMRIAYLMEEKKVWPSQILAITFTNKAAREMETRVLSLMKEEVSKPTICTIHSLCVRILRQEIEAMGYPKNFTILDVEDQKAILKEYYKEHSVDKNEISFASALSYISNNKTENVSVEEANKIADFSSLEKKKVKIYEYYLHRQKELFALDFDDLILWTVRLFDRFEVVLQKWQQHFHYILVDEFQDIDRIQYQLIKQLTGKDNSLLVVGDPDQTIYTWRGADVRIIVNFEKDFSNTKTILLTQNYRSTSSILKGANSVIKNNKQRVDKELFTDNQSKEKIYHFSAGSDEYQAAWIAQEMKSIRLKTGTYSEMAVLYRANYLSRALEKALMDERIPYIIYGGLRFFERQVVKDALSYLRLIVVGDDLSLTRVLNRPKRGLGLKTVEMIAHRARELNCSQFELLQKEELFKGKTQDTIRQFVQRVERWRSLQQKGGLELFDFFELVMDESGYRAFLEAEKNTDNLGYLKSLMEDIRDFSRYHPEATLEEYLQSVALYGDKEELVENDFVQLMTVHASKGLEFDTVFVSDLNEGIFPSERSLQEGYHGVEEERRLAYVAFTRARKHLYLTDAGGYSFMLQRVKTPSRFIDEIEDLYIEHRGVVKSQEKQESSFYSQFMEKPVREVKKWKKGDIIEHVKFGEGVVILQEGEFVTVAFAYPFGTKRLQASHPSLTAKK